MDGWRIIGYPQNTFSSLVFLNREADTLHLWETKTAERLGNNEKVNLEQMLTNNDLKIACSDVIAFLCMSTHYFRHLGAQLSPAPTSRGHLSHTSSGKHIQALSIQIRSD